MLFTGQSFWLLQVELQKISSLLKIDINNIYERQLNRMLMLKIRYL